MRHKGKTYWRKKRDKLLKKHLLLQGKVLDVGCGWRTYGRDAVRLDINPECQPDLLTDIQGRTGLRGESFDTVLALDVLEHLRDPHQAVAEIKRVLKPGGRLYLTVPFCFPRHGTEYYRFSDLALMDLLDGFEVEIIPVLKSRVWNLVWNYYPQDRLVEGYFVRAQKKDTKES
jgi:ubiquinone/menaquinone biosynthesis C-methylase UbiE